MSSTSLLSSLDCFTVNRNPDGSIPPNFGDFSPKPEIQFNRYSQNDDKDDGVIVTIELCQTEGKSQCGNLAYVVRHRDWNATTFQNDIALIFLQEDLPEDRQIPNVALNCDPNVPVADQELEVFGWGYISNRPDVIRPELIQTATINALTNADCDEKMAPDTDITDDMLCAKKEGISAAPGDSGTCNSTA